MGLACFFVGSAQVAGLHLEIPAGFYPKGRRGNDFARLRARAIAFANATT
jgi:hypothetical protein